MSIRIIFIVSLIFVLNCKSSENEGIIRIHPDVSDVKPSSHRFYKEVLPSLSKKKVLLVTNPSGIGINPEKIIQKFAQYEIRLQYLVGLEHGFLGLDEDFSSTPVTIDSTFNVPIYHIYKLKPSDIQLLLAGVDAVIFDVQDMGMRCYTYLTVLKRIMDQIPDKKIQFVLLDHVSPGIEVPTSGDELKTGFENFAADFPLLFFTGLTLGESAKYYNAEYLGNRIDLRIIPVENYTRGMRYEKTGLVWNTPSPNLPNLDSARNYMALVLLEGVNVSVGRGTQAPFVYFGAPWFRDSEEFASVLQANSNSEYYFQPVFFKPAFGPYKDKICRGLRMSVVNLNYNPIKLAYNLIRFMKDKYKRDFRWNSYNEKYFVDNLWGNEGFRKAIDANLTFEDFSSKLKNTEIKYASKIKKYYIY
ncbi:MAG: DUF1343 domain-containing protein [Leptospiraceae bacterium]|nr:DUF1343 domain-containing protein [Leptospiraceae bacterium]